MTERTPEQIAAAEAFKVKEKLGKERMKALYEHVVGHLKARTLVVTGDESHFSIETIIKVAFANIDRPKKYQWQEDTVYEDDFARTFGRLFEHNWLCEFALGDITEEKFEAIKAGEIGFIVSGKHKEYKCYECSGRISVSVKGNHIHFTAAGECGKHRNYTIDVEFPTGEIVFADWPDRFSELHGMKHFGEERYNLDGLEGERASSDNMARFGILHMFVGNTSPALAYNPKTHDIVIGRDWCYDRKTDKESRNPAFRGTTPLGSFCTDLWWVTMLDKSKYDELMALLPAERPAGSYDKGVEIAKVKPGRYRFTAHYGHSPVYDPDNEDANGVYVSAEYLGPCE